MNFIFFTYLPYLLCTYQQYAFPCSSLNNCCPTNCCCFTCCCDFVNNVNNIIKNLNYITDKKKDLIKDISNIAYDLNDGKLQVNLSSGTDINYEAMQEFINVFFIKNNKDNCSLVTQEISFYDTKMTSGVRRQMFTNTKKFLLQEETFEKDKDKRLFKEIKVGERVYYNFQDENIEITNNDRNKYEILGYMLAASLRHMDYIESLFLNLNPLIYKIMINCCKLENENGENILKLDDLQYFYKETYDFYKSDKYGKSEIVEGENLDDDVKDQFDHMLKSFKNQLPKIKIFYDSLCYFLNVNGFDLFDYFSIDDFKELKEFLEGPTDITYDDIKDKIYSNRKKDFPEYYEYIHEIIKEFDNEQLRLLLIYWTGSDTISTNSKLEIFFYGIFEKENFLAAETCFNRLEFYCKTLEQYCNFENKDIKETIREALEDAIKPLKTYRFCDYK